MLVIRPLQSDDLEDLYAMAQKAGKGLTTLPADTAHHCAATWLRRRAWDASVHQCRKCLSAAV